MPGTDCFVGSCDVCLLTRYELEGGCTSIVAQDDHGRLIHGRRLPSHSKEERYASKLLGAGPTKSLNMVPNLQSTHRYPISISSYSTSADVFLFASLDFLRRLQGSFKSFHASGTWTLVFS